MSGPRIVSYTGDPIHYAQVMALVHTSTLTGNPFSQIGDALSGCSFGVEVDSAQIRSFEVHLSESLMNSSVPNILSNPDSVGIIQHNIGLVMPKLAQMTDPDQVLRTIEAELFIDPENQEQPSPITLQFALPKIGTRAALIISSDLSQPKIRAIHAFKRFAQVKRELPKPPATDDLKRVDEIKRQGLFRNQIVRFSILLSSDKIPRHFTLNPGQSLIVGRNGADIQIPNTLDRTSRQHLKISNIDGLLFIEDLNSTNGTFIGDTQIRSKHVTETTTFDLSHQEKMIIELFPVISDPKAEVANGNTKIDVSINIIDDSGDNAPIILTESFTPGYTLTFGRSKNGVANIKLTDRNISRTHCALANRDGFLYFEDLNSSYGTRNAAKVKITEPALIDETNPNYFYIGDLRIEIFVLRRSAYHQIAAESSQGQQTDVASEAEQAVAELLKAAEVPRADSPSEVQAKEPSEAPRAVADLLAEVKQQPAPSQSQEERGTGFASRAVELPADFLAEQEDQIKGDEDGIEEAAAPYEGDATQLESLSETDATPAPEAVSRAVELPMDFLEGYTGKTDVSDAELVSAPSEELRAVPAAMPEIQPSTTKDTEEEALASIEGAGETGSDAQDQEKDVEFSVEEGDVISEDTLYTYDEALSSIDNAREAHIALLEALRIFNESNIFGYKRRPPRFPSYQLLKRAESKDGSDPDMKKEATVVIEYLYTKDEVEDAIERARIKDFEAIEHELNQIYASELDSLILDLSILEETPYSHDEAVSVIDRLRQDYVSLFDALRRFNENTLTHYKLSAPLFPSSIYLKEDSARVIPSFIKDEVIEAVEEARREDLEKIKFELTIAILYVNNVLHRSGLEELRRENERLSRINAGLESTAKEQGSEIGRIQTSSADGNRQLRETIESLRTQLGELKESLRLTHEELEKIRAQNERAQKENTNLSHRILEKEKEISRLQQQIEILRDSVVRLTALKQVSDNTDDSLTDEAVKPPDTSPDSN